MWNAKYSLENIHSFSPFQLATGQSPSLLYAATYKLSAILPMQTREIIRKHLNNIYKAREALVMSENSNKIRRELRRNVQTSNDDTFVIGNGEDQLKF